MGRFVGCHRKDSNHDEIVGYAKAFGCTVVDVHGTSCGIDIMVGFRGSWKAIEIKSSPKDELTKKEKDVQAECRAMGLPHYVVTSTEEMRRVLL